ncbi:MULTISPECIES: YheT family hydrolase [unclassified Chromobacterium]|uniref:YheT family hydrolase n=1 Tax=unclassified Chromobacterium TaxID=2641838 RepID=UPI000D2F5096|nr:MULTISPECIES: alpha/beta fold hydrolase [unclassified Chromobacterium]MCP1290070.1 alpha/beta fold hydrolase [Chromobacterium sp. S0633]PTU65608.1 alpha/beta hydrolase [Chromobacterium sp. Panama]UJB30076.1 alpha/beta fold hydrolase [Chromobacterium sp. Beijing]
MAYQSPAWLRGGHAQTIWPALAIKTRRPDYRRELWDTPDGARIALDFVPGRPGAPLVVLFHGLEGSSDSHYARALMQAVQRRGWNGVVPHFRGCGGVDNPLPRAYHAGDGAEVRWILSRLAQRFPVLAAAAVSLGGSMLLNYLADEGAQALPRAAAAVSAPLDLVAASTRLDRGLGKLLYTRMFMGTLKPKALESLQRHPGLFDGGKLSRARTFIEFDDLVTAPIHGFGTALNYWRSASAKPRLGQIARPTLVLNARNDPFLPEQALPRQTDVAASVTLEFPRHGGHVGFASGAFPGTLDWLPSRLLEFFEPHLD